MSKRVGWRHDGVYINVSNFPAKVEVQVCSIHIREEYDAARTVDGINHRFYIDKNTGLDTFMVYNDRDLAVVKKEMCFLNFVRLNWRQMRTDRRTVLAMGVHPRLGAGSPLALLDADILETIAQQL